MDLLMGRDKYVVVTYGWAENDALLTTSKRPVKSMRRYLGINEQETITIMPVN